jgi:DNA excision repair protein ERCC-2
LKYLVAVRALCEFTAKHGDLDLRFTPSPSAQEGMAGHALVASRRGESYQSEVGLEGDYKALTVRGRADGYDPDKTSSRKSKPTAATCTPWPTTAAHLHWAQLKIYGWLLCADRKPARHQPHPRLLRRGQHAGNAADRAFHGRRAQGIL